ncbi:MAG: D-aminoacylase [Thermoanaerobaculia bacterium]
MARVPSRRFALLSALLGVAAAAGAEPPPAAPLASTLITHVLIFDGSGAPGRLGSLRIAGERIVAVGDLAPLAGESIVEGNGRALAPGFIDTHSHGDGEIFDHPDALAAVSQGITTIVGGQDGDSELPLAEFFAHLGRQPAAVNLASYAGHGTLRDRVLGKDYKRAATAPEIAAMGALLQGEMDAGALGLSSGLEYDPGIYSTTAELVELARVAGASGGRYISHVRSEDRDFWAAIDEILTIGREAHLPVQISHVKLAMRSLWGQAPRLLKLLDDARRSGVEVTADIYPYLYWHAGLTVLFPQRDFENLESAEFALREIAPPEGLIVAGYLPEPSYAGKTLAEIARLRKESPARTLIELIRRSEKMRADGKTGVEHIIATSMVEADVEQLLAWPETNLCTDGQLDGSHPRGFGSYPRILGRYVRERHVLSLAEAIHKASGLAADHLGFRDRGRLAPGQAADLVLFDPATVIDRATTDEPHAISRGIERVWVNGAVVYEQGKATGARPGKVLRRPGTPAIAAENTQ